MTRYWVDDLLSEWIDGNCENCNPSAERSEMSVMVVSEMYPSLTPTYRLCKRKTRSRDPKGPLLARSYFSKSINGLLPENHCHFSWLSPIPYA